MQGMQRLASLGVAAGLLVLVAGCSSTVTNLTPTTQITETSGLYHFETEWETNQRSVGLRASDIKAFVVVDEQFHPMQRVPGMTNRWEALVPLPKDKGAVYYFYKWEYTTAGWGGASHLNSRRSPLYRLAVVPSTPAP